MNTKSNETLKQIIENYHSQLEIIGGYSEVSLYNYLKGIGVTNQEMIYALEYNEIRVKSEKEKSQIELIKDITKMINSRK